MKGLSRVLCGYSAHVSHLSVLRLLWSIVDHKTSWLMQAVLYSADGTGQDFWPATRPELMAFDPWPDPTRSLSVLKQYPDNGLINKWSQIQKCRDITWKLENQQVSKGINIMELGQDFWPVNDPTWWLLTRDPTQPGRWVFWSSTLTTAW